MAYETGDGPEIISWRTAETQIRPPLDYKTVAKKLNLCCAIYTCKRFCRYQIINWPTNQKCHIVKLLSTPLSESKVNR